MITKIMGILNVTPDSFSDGGDYFDAGPAISRGEEMFAQGAAIVDVGGESTRPGAEPVSVEEELRRVLPVVEALSGLGVVSIDTAKADVARAAVGVGATIINDVTASLGPVAGELGVSWIAMHMLGTPRTMQSDPQYDDVVSEVLSYLTARAEAALAAGAKEVFIDPGIGFGKTVEHNLALLGNIDKFVAAYPTVVGASRKSFIAALNEGVDTDARMPGSLAVAMWCAQQGVSLVRVHDVAETMQALRVYGAMVEAQQ